MVTNAELQQEVTELRDLVRQLQEATPSSSRTSPSPPPPVRKEPKLPEPPEFDGKPPEYATFINHCDLYFRMRPITFDSDYVKVAYVISRCRGSPAEWGHSLIESSSNLLHDYDAYKDELASMYADKQRHKALRRKLITLKQTGSASKFAAEFKSTANILGIDDESRFALFTNGLKPDVQRALALVRNIDTFEELVDSVVQIDHVNFTLAKAEAKADPKSSSKSLGGTNPQGKGKATHCRPLVLSNLVLTALHRSRPTLPVLLPPRILLLALGTPSRKKRKTVAKLSVCVDSAVEITSSAIVLC